MQLQGNDYAKVADRVKEFRQENPKGLIETTPTIQPDGQILFKARVLKDKSKEESAEATGHALGANKGQKSFEKTETVAIGRALALLGYGADGEIASSEEMEEFFEYKAEQLAQTVETYKDRIEEAKNLVELKEVWASVPAEARKALESIKNDKKNSYDNK